MKDDFIYIAVFFVKSSIPFVAARQAKNIRIEIPRDTILKPIKDIPFNELLQIMLKTPHTAPKSAEAINDTKTAHSDSITDQTAT